MYLPRHLLLLVAPRRACRMMLLCRRAACVARLPRTPTRPSPAQSQRLLHHQQSSLPRPAAALATRHAWAPSWPGARGLASATADDEPATTEQASRWHKQATKAAKAGELREASVLYEKALRARIELLGEYDAETDRTRHSLAATLEVCQQPLPHPRRA